MPDAPRICSECHRPFDLNLTRVCIRCYKPFILTANTQQWFGEKRMHLPNRCGSCRAMRKAARAAQAQTEGDKEDTS
jgi:Probable zinc-ribbon domain